MSLDAITAVLNLPVKKSSHKFVLFVVANFADEHWESYASIPAIAQKTSLDEKTVRNALHQLVNQGLLRDTGKRTGANSQVPVYQLLIDSTAVPSQKRQGTKNGRVPKTEPSQISRGTLPKTESSSSSPPLRLSPSSSSPGTQKDTAERRVRAQTPPPKRKASKTVPEDFVVTEALREWAAGEIPEVNIDMETAIFRDHEFKDPHSDWEKAWRRWMRRATTYQSGPTTTHPARKNEHTGHRISNYPSGKYCHTCRRELLVRELV